jgi:hypothetical protein
LVLGLLLIAIGASAAIVSGNIQRDSSQTNASIAVFPLELVGLLLGGSAAVVAARGPQKIAMGVYLVIVAAAIGTLFPLWLPEDDTIIGSAVLAGELAGVGAALVLAGAERSGAIVIGGGVLVFLVVTAGGMVDPLARLHVPVIVAPVVTAYAVWRRTTDAWPLIIVAAVATIGVLALRGPDDWASGSHTLKLYSLPILLLATGFSLVISRRPAGQFRGER